jgi:hypothetical protein
LCPSLLLIDDQLQKELTRSGPFDSAPLFHSI